MKTKALLIITTAILLCSAIGCKKFISTTPTDSLSPENYYKTETDLDNSLTAIYDRLGDLQLYGQGLFSNLAFSDDLFFYNFRTGIQVNDINPATNTVYGLWERCYMGIERANMLLENIDNATAVAQDKRDVIKGQAIFLRAYYYFLLVEHFGGVPLKLKSTKSPSEELLPRSTIAEVYAKVVTDMKLAIGSLKPISSYGFNGRISKTAAQGILARIYLTMAGAPLKDVTKYAEAKTLLEEVINSNEHDLSPSYSQIFINHSQDKYDIKECLWEAEFAGNRTSSFTEEGTLGSYLGIPSSDNEIGFGSNLIRTTKKLYDVYDDLDARRDWSIASFKYVTTTANGVTTTVKENYTAAQIYNRSPGKWRREYELLKPKNTSYTPTNFPILRYSDILLMYAEVDNELNGPQAKAIEFVNKVRRRGWGKLSMGEVVKTITLSSQGTGYTVAPTVTISGGGGSGAKATATVSGGKVIGIIITDRGTGFTSNPIIVIAGNGAGATATAIITQLAEADLLPAHISNKENFKAEIRNERYREFAFEGVRKHDLLRWGIYTETMRDLATDITGTAPTEFLYAATAASLTGNPKFVFFPIPAIEIAINKKVTQNLGW